MQTYTTESIDAALRWVHQCTALGQTSRSNLLAVLNSARFRAALRPNRSWRIVIEYLEGPTADRVPRRVRVAVAGRASRVTITGDRGAWILAGTDTPD